MTEDPFIIKVLLHLGQNIQIIGQYLKFNNTYASVKTFACLNVRKFLTQKRALILLFALQQIFLI